MRAAYQQTELTEALPEQRERSEVLTGSGPTVPITTDARMLFHSGIGRYLREVLARWPADGRVAETFIVNSDEQREWLLENRAQAKFVRTNATIYSWKEQLLPARVPRRSVYWVPHYNLPRVCGARLVATVHDAAPLVLRDAFPGRVQRLAAKFFFGAVRRAARRVIAVSQFTADELALHAGIAPRAMQVVPNGVDEVWKSKTAAAPRDSFRLLFVGNLKAHKNLGRLLDAVEILRTQRGLDVGLDVVGQVSGFRVGLEGDTAARIERSPWITLHGKVTDERLREIYAQVGALVFPSLYEGFGLPMLEAMAAGCPVVSSFAGALPEVGGPDHERGGCVVYFQPRNPPHIAERLEYFLRLPAEARLRMSEAGQARADLFSWDTTATKTREILLHEAGLIKTPGTAHS